MYCVYDVRQHSIFALPYLLPSHKNGLAGAHLFFLLQIRSYFLIIIVYVYAYTIYLLDILDNKYGQFTGVKLNNIRNKIHYEGKKFLCFWYYRILKQYT